MRDVFSMPVMRALGAASARVSAPVGEMLALLLAFCLLAALWRAIIRKKWKPLCLFLSTTALLAAFTCALWLPVAGDARYAAAPERRETKDIEALSRHLLNRADVLQNLLPKTCDRLDIVGDAARLSGVPVKAARYPELLSMMDAAGMYIPFTGEAIVDARLSPVTLPFAACHEAAHALGYGREDEANYAAYRMCLKGDVSFRYSGTLYALKYAMDALRDADAAAWLACVQTMSAPVHADFYRLNGYHNAPPQNRFWGGVSEVFLRLSRQEGRKAYGRMTELLLADFIS